MPDSLRTGPIVELLDHPVEIDILCKGCGRFAVARPVYLHQRGIRNLADGERRLKCAKCGGRPALRYSLQWPVGGGRDRRRDPPPLPEWMRGKIS